jgi:predicted transporter
MQLVDPELSTRRWLKVGLAVGGAVAGAAFGVVLTRLGKIVAGAPPATLANYAWNAAVFGVVAGIVSPVVSWSVLRRAPLWRTVIEPLAFAVAGGAAAVILGAPVLLFVLPPAGLVLGFVRLQRRYPDRHALPSTRPANER